MRPEVERELGVSAISEMIVAASVGPISARNSANLGAEVFKYDSRPDCSNAFFLSQISCAGSPVLGLAVTSPITDA